MFCVKSHKMQCPHENKRYDKQTVANIIVILKIPNLLRPLKNEFMIVFSGKLR